MMMMKVSWLAVRVVVPNIELEDLKPSVEALEPAGLCDCQ
jgi:hypothetical protein